MSEPVAAVALAGFRSLLRTPEAKMMLLSPVIMSVIFGSMLWRSRNGISDSFRPLVAIGGMGFVLFGVVQLMSNQFGFDRDGFRVFVLSAARRRDILIGKNLSFAPLVLGMALIMLVALQAVSPMSWDHFLAMIPQYDLDVPHLLPADEFPFDLRAGPRRRGIAQALEPEVDHGSLASGHVHDFLSAHSGVTCSFRWAPRWSCDCRHGAGMPVCLLLSLLECAL